MLKKITALLLLTAFTNVYAFMPIDQSRIGTELNQTFDTLNYKLNVEWDQKDAKFFDEAVAGFEEEIATLQSSGLTKEELMNYSLGKIKDNEIKRDINELAKVISNSQMTDQEARAFVVSKLNSTYSHGASWSGGSHGHACVLIGAIVIILIIAHHYNTNNCPPTYSSTPGVA